MQAGLIKDSLFSELPKQIGNYNVDTVQGLPQEYARVNEVGAFQSVRHIRKGYVDTESELIGITKVLNKKDPAVYTDYGLQGNDRGGMGVLMFSDLQELSEAVGTRERRPNSNLPHIDRFEYPVINPQNVRNIIYQEYHRGGEHSRNLAKDSYAKKCSTQLRL